MLAAERPDLRVYAVDPGDMNTRMHQEAFPGEDISDRPPPQDSVPGLLALVEGDVPSGTPPRRRTSERCTRDEPPTAAPLARREAHEPPEARG